MIEQLSSQQHKQQREWTTTGAVTQRVRNIGGYGGRLQSVATNKKKKKSPVTQECARFRGKTTSILNTKREPLATHDGRDTTNRLVCVILPCMDDFVHVIEELSTSTTISQNGESKSPFSHPPSSFETD